MGDRDLWACCLRREQETFKGWSVYGAIDAGDALLRLLRSGGLDDVLTQIEQGLDDPSAQVRVNALRVLAKLHHRPLADRVEALLDDPESVVRRQAAVAAAEMPAPSVLPTLVERLIASTEDVEDQDLGAAAARLAPDDELIPLAKRVLEERPGADWPLWFLQREVVERLDSRQQIQFFREWAERQPEPHNVTPVVGVLDPLRRLFEELRELEDDGVHEAAGVIAAAWRITDPSFIQLLQRRPNPVFRGMLAALAVGLIYELDLLRFVSVIPLRVLQDESAPTSVIEWKERLSLDEPQEAGVPIASAVQREARSDLRTLLAQRDERATHLLLRHAQTFAGQVEALSPAERHQLEQLLEEWKPKEGFHHAIHQDEPGSWRIETGAAAWLHYGPALNAHLTPKEWVDIPTTGIILGDASRWLRQQWQPEVSVLLLADPPRSPRGWSVALRGSPKPLAPAVARAAAGAAAVSKDDEWSIREIAERLLEEEQAVANLRVLASEPANKRVVLPYLAKAGDPGAAHELLVELRARLNAGEVPDREDVIWLDGVADPAELPWLFECLEQAAAKAERSPFGPFGPLQAAIARIDGEEAVRRYDDLLAREPFEGAQFLRSQRDGVLQDQLRAVGLKAARSVLAELSLPVLAP